MALFTVENLSFAYDEQPVLQQVSFSIEESQFVALCGLTGSGKSTLLRLLKKELQPVGKLQGSILYDGMPLEQASPTAISFVMQKPDEQLVMEKVWQELAFPLENQALASEEMEQRMAEVLHFLGIHHLFNRRTASLSGGQKQMVNLAAALVTHPQVLLLDEPTAQLDPLAATQFIQLLARVHRELGITILMIEHRLEELVPIVDEILLLEAKTILYQEAPATLLPKLKQHPLLSAFGAAPYMFTKMGISPIALTVQEAKKSLPIIEAPVRVISEMGISPTILTVKQLYFRFEKKVPDLLANVQLQVGIGDILAIVGGNGTGKSTLLQAIAGLVKPYKGKIHQLTEARHPFALMPQNPATIFMKSSVREELDCLKKMASASFEARKAQIITLLQLQPLLDMQPADLSGGQQQLVAFAKIYCLHCPIVLLDEPTKGLDVQAKELILRAIQQLRQEGTTVVIVTHDLDFTAQCATHCTMLFQGKLTPIQPVRQFFCTNRFYTTSARRIAAHFLPDAITCEDIMTTYTQQGATTYA